MIDAKGSIRAAAPTPALRKAALIYLGFVVYGSLIPFQFRSLAPAEAWSRFLHTPFLHLGIESRADWVANILLYLPLAFLLQQVWFGTARTPASRARVSVATLGACLGVAVLVEFTQLFFAPRTVSLNDLIAESFGSVLGIVVGLLFGRWLLQTLSEITTSHDTALRGALWITVLCYGLLSLYPFDIIVSTREWNAKLSDGSVDWLFAARSRCFSTRSCSFKLLVEIAGCAPLGLLLAAVRPRASLWREIIIAFVVGALAGVIIEGLQLLVASAISQGLSVLTRALGTAIGVLLFRAIRSTPRAMLLKVLKGLTLLALPVYLAAVVHLAGWYSGPWTGIGSFGARLAAVHWMPFYYHYFTSEASATVSLLVNAATYGVIGIGIWIVIHDRPGHSGPRIAAVLAGLLAAVMECGKLFTSVKHPDPTNILIAWFAARYAFMLCRQLFDESP